MDHYHQIANVGPVTDPMLEAYTLLGGVAARTSRVALGAMVTGVTYRNPAFLAKVLTTLDIVSSGRAILGIGAAWNEAESRAYGYDWPSTSERFERLEDALQICRSMFTQRETTFRGRVHHVEGAINVPQPVQPGGPKILIGGGGEQKTLRLVATYADMWNGFGDAETIRHKLDVLRGHCEAVGRDFDEIVTTRLGTLIVAETADEAERMRRAWQQEHGVDDESVGDASHVGRRRRRDGESRNPPGGDGPGRAAVQHAGRLLGGAGGHGRRSARSPSLKGFPLRPNHERLALLKG